MSEKERRSLGIETRAADTGRTIFGHAALYNTRTDLGYITEDIAPGAFDGCMGDDVRCLFNHDPDHILGRSSAGTLRLAKDERGLRFEADMPDSPIGDTVLGAVKRGDISGNSFSFTIAEDAWDYTGEKPHRTFRKVERLYDVGPVTFPAYEATELSARTLEAAKREEPKPAPDFTHERRRLDLLAAE